MDGHFVQGFSYGPKFVTDLQKVIPPKIDTSAHLMVRGAHNLIELFFLKPPKRIIIHLEDQGSMKNVAKIFSLLDTKGIGLGFAINPSTKISLIDKALLALAKEILVMTVVPGKGGQKLIEEALDKTIILNRLRKMNNFNYTITVDGGINSTTMKIAAKYPIDQYVVGSYVWKDISNLKRNIGILMELIHKRKSFKD